MAAEAESLRGRSLARLLIGLGCAGLALAALFNTALVAALDPGVRLSPEALRETHRSQLAFALVGLALALAGALLLRFRPALFERRTAVRIALAALSVSLSLFVLERLL